MENSDNRSFRVVAFVPAYNEEDIIVPSLRYLIEQGVDVYLIDNWSTDSTHELASQFLGEGLLAIERFPPEGPPRYHNWKNMLARMEEIAKEIDADWFLLQGADEVHVSPWPGSTLKDAIMRVNQEGFNSIDHTVVAFHPVDNGFVPGTDFEAYFKHFEFSSHPAHFLVVNGWKNLRRPVSLAEFAGHDVRFQGRRIYPYKFLLKHYQIRSQAHGEKKILR
jgi:glycosyltransferase involved in cell wall biosynthesis